MQIVIEISEDTYIVTCNESVLPPDVRNIVTAIKNGTPLPKRHGRLIDAKDVGEYLTLADVPTIIEADKGYEAKVINHGNCMMCGKELDEGLFFCKECEEKDRKARGKE